MSMRATEGRQGNPNVLSFLEESLKKAGKEYIIVLLSEIFPSKLALFGDGELLKMQPPPRLGVLTSSVRSGSLDSGCVSAALH